MTLYYIIKSGRSFCFGCDKFLMAGYFACVECFEKSSGPFYVCTSCYREHNYNHSHSNSQNPPFLDNYSLLEAHRLSAVNQVERSSSNSHSSSSHEAPSRSGSQRDGSSRSSSKLRTAFKAFDIGMTVITIGSAAGCSIM